jgi:hypothetical protein
MRCPTPQHGLCHGFEPRIGDTTENELSVMVARVGKRQKVWARLKLAEMRQELGGVCSRCGASERLEFHVWPPDSAHHGTSTDTRATYYRARMLLGEVSLLCKDCHLKLTRQGVPNATPF